MRVHHTSLGVEDQTRLYGGSQGKLFLVADGMGGHAAGVMRELSSSRLCYRILAEHKPQSLPFA